MGNHQSSDSVLQNLWTAERAIPVVPLNPNLDALRVLTKHSNCYHDVGNVISLCKPGQHQVLSPRECKNSLATKSMGTQSCTIADNYGTVATKLTDAPTWFQNATSVEVRIPEFWVREYNMENWADMVHHFNPDMQKVNSKLDNPDRSSSERELFIVQKVVLVSHITITATYTTSAAPDVRSPVTLSPGIQIEPKTLSRGTVVEFTISGTQENQKLPIAFSGFKHTYDKFGELKSEPQTQADTAPGASSSDVEGDEDEDEEDEDEDEDETEEDEEDVAAVVDDANMGDFLDEGDWCAQIISENDPTAYVIFDHIDEDREDRDERPPAGPPGTPAVSPPGSPRSPRDLENID